MRDLQGYVETRHQLLTLKGNNRANWVSFAVAHHINGSHDMAVQVGGTGCGGGERETLFTLSSPLILTPQILEAYEKTLDSEVLPSEAYEHGEMLMYKAQV